MTFAEQIVYAMFKPSKYKEIINLKKERFVAFIIVLMLAICVVREVIPTAAIISSFGGFDKLFTEKMSDMEFKDGELKIEEPFKMSLATLTIIIDTDNEIVPESKLDKTNAYITVGSKYISTVVNAEGRILRYRDLYFADKLQDGFSNETLKSVIPFIYLCFFVNFVVYCVGCFLKYALLAFIFGLSIDGINKMANIGLTKGEIFKLCFYGQTLGIIISNFNAALGLMPAMLVSIICIFISIHMINSGLRNMGKINQA